jgi:hypothetical protein
MADLLLPKKSNPVEVMLNWADNVKLCQVKKKEGKERFPASYGRVLRQCQIMSNSEFCGAKGQSTHAIMRSKRSTILYLYKVPNN